MTQEPDSVVARFLAWLTDHRPELTPEERSLIEEASLYASNAHSGQMRKSGIPYEEHPFEVARILSENGMDAEVIAAGILHDVVEDTEITCKDIEERFGISRERVRQIETKALAKLKHPSRSHFLEGWDDAFEDASE